VQISYENRSLSFEEFLEKLETCPDTSQLLQLPTYLMLRIENAGDFYSPAVDNVMSTPTRWGFFLGQAAYIMRMRGMKPI